MKPIHVFSPRANFLALVALCVATSGLADPPVIDFYGVQKRITYLQTSSVAPVTPSTTINDPNGPYFFDATVSGSNLNNLLPAPQVSSTGVGPLTLVLKSTSEYGFTGNNPAQHGFGTKGALDTAFPNDTFTLNNLPGSVALDLSPDTYPTDIPAITNGTWSGSALQVNAATGMTLNFNTFSAYNAGAGGIIEFHLYSTNGGSINGDVDSVMTFSPTTAQTSYTINPGVLTAGQTYFGELSFSSFTEKDTTSLPGSTGYALFTDMTGFSISAIPEPSTYGVMAGFFVLGVVLWRRRFTDRCA